MIEEAYYDHKNVLTPRWKGGWALKRVAYDDRGNPVKRYYLGLKKKPILSIDELTYDPRGRLIKEHELKPDGTSYSDPERMTTNLYSYDERGNVIGQSMLNAKGDAVYSRREDNFGCAKEQWKYDARGRKTDYLCYNRKGEKFRWARQGMLTHASGAYDVATYGQKDFIDLAREPKQAKAFGKRRRAMIAHMKKQAKKNPKHYTFAGNVMAAMAEIPMELFAPPNKWGLLYQDRTIPVATVHETETISAPHMTGMYMTILKIKKGEKVLELKSGSGYQTVLLAMLGAEVYSIETNIQLYSFLRQVLAELGLKKTWVKLDNVYEGWAEHAPYDAIVATAAYPSLPYALLKQLRPGGRLLAPVGVGNDQQLTLYTKNADGTIETKHLMGVLYGMMPKP
jgi:protein-L-isoaspartate(D-aspartate) O-methyltransferase